MDNISVNPGLILFLLFIPIFLLSISVHEFAHSVIAFIFGDNTAKQQGRMTLNPIKHLDIVGSIIIPFAAFASGIAIIGWAKPVPINPQKFSNHRLGEGLVSFAGPLSNFLLSVIILTMILILPEIEIIKTHSRTILLSDILKYGIYINLFLALFNLIPIPPLDGAHILHVIFYNRFTEKWLNIGFAGTIILLIFIYSPLWKYFNQILNSILKIFLEFM